MADFAISQPWPAVVSSCVMVMAINHEFGEISALTVLSSGSTRWAQRVEKPLRSRLLEPYRTAPMGAADALGRENVLTLPPSVLRPILPEEPRVNQMLPSGPVVITSATVLLIPGVANSWTTPAGEMLPMPPACVNHRFPVRSSARPAAVSRSLEPCAAAGTEKVERWPLRV